MVRPGDGYSRINASKKSLICLNNYIKSCLETVEDKYLELMKGGTEIATDGGACWSNATTKRART